MKAIYGKNINAFINKLLIVFSSLNNKVVLNGYFCEVKNNEFLFVFKEEPIYSNLEEAVFGKEISSAYIIDLIEEGNNYLSIDKKQKFFINSKDEINDIEQLIPKCKKKDIIPDDNWTDEVIIRLKNKDDLGLVVNMLFARENDNINCILSDDKEFPFFLFVKDISIFIVLYLIGEKIGEVYYRLFDSKTPLNYFIPWSLSYPLLKKKDLFPPKKENEITIFLKNNTLLNIDIYQFKSIYSFLIIQFKNEKKIIETESVQDFRLNIDLELKKADSIQQTTLPFSELWVIPEQTIDIFLKDLYCPESALKGMEAIVFEEKEFGKSILLWTGGSGEDLNNISLASLAHPDVLGFYRYAQVKKNLFLSNNHIFFPLLEPLTLKNVFELKTKLFTLVYKKEENTFVLNFDINDFKPIRKALIDYSFLINKKNIKTLAFNPAYNFETAVEYPEPKPRVIIKEVYIESKDIEENEEQDVINNDNNNYQESNNLSESIDTKLLKENQKINVIKKKNNKNKPERKENSFEDLIQNYAVEFLQKYQNLTFSDWQKYLEKASFVKWLWKDSYYALISLMTFYPEKDYIGTICNGLRISSDWLRENSLDKQFSDLFDHGWQSRRIEDIILRYSLIKGSISSNTYFIIENELRQNIRTLGKLVYKSNNPKLIWMYCRVSWFLTDDKLILEEGLIIIQNLLQTPDANLCIPPTICSELTGEFFKHNQENMSELLDMFSFSPLQYIWVQLLINLYLERSGLFIMQKSHIKKIENLLDIEPFNDFPKEKTAEINAFFSYLKILYSCSMSHPEECDFFTHIEYDSNDNLINKIINSNNKSDLFIDELSNNEIVIDNIPTDPDNYYDFFKNLINNIINLKRNDNKKALLVIKKKISDWQLINKNNTLIIAILNIIKILFANKEETVIEQINSGIKKLFNQDLLIEQKRLYCGLFFEIILLEIEELKSINFKYIYSIIIDNKLLNNDSNSISIEEIKILNYIIKIIFYILTEKKNNFNDIIAYERQEIKKIISKEYDIMTNSSKEKPNESI